MKNNKVQGGDKKTAEFIKNGKHSDELYVKRIIRPSVKIISELFCFVLYIKFYKSAKILYNQTCIINFYH